MAAAKKIRRRDPEATRADILTVATEEFANHGYNGARVDQIAQETATTKRMIYYYFGSKEGLYLEVLENVYRQFRTLENEVDLDGLDSVDALRKLAEFIYDHHSAHPNFIRLVQIENINRAEHLQRSLQTAELKGSSVSKLEALLKKGIDQKLFRSDLDAIDVSIMVYSFSTFQVANRHTFKQVYGRDMLDEKLHDKYRKLAGDMIVETMTAKA